MSKLFCVFAVCALAGLATTAARADEVVGAIWQVKNKEGFEWKFRAGPKGVVWTVPKEGKPEKLGTWTAKDAETVMKIDAPDQGKIGAKRTITIVRVQKNPSKWQGESELSNGKKIPLTVTLVKD